MKINLYILLILSTFMNCCTYSKLNCFYKEQKNIKQERVYNHVREAFLDSLSNWIERDLQLKRNLSGAIYRLDDALICDSKREKCIMFLLVRAKEGEIIYNTKFTGAERNENDSWNFYYRSYQTVYYPELSGNNGFDHMSKETYLSLIQDGLIGLNCKINDEYLTSQIWFNDDRKRMHQKFLKDIPYRNNVIKEQSQDE